METKTSGESSPEVMSTPLPGKEHSVIMYMFNLFRWPCAKGLVHRAGLFGRE